MGIGKEERYEFSYDIEYLREIFNCEEKYKNINDFIKRVIDIGIREINEKSDIEVTYEYIKTSKKVTGIKFEVWYNIKNNFKRKDKLINKHEDTSKQPNKEILPNEQFAEIKENTQVLLKQEEIVLSIPKQIDIAVSDEPTQTKKTGFFQKLFNKNKNL